MSLIFTRKMFNFHYCKSFFFFFFFPFFNNKHPATAARFPAVSNSGRKRETDARKCKRVQATRGGAERSAVQVPPKNVPILRASPATRCVWRKMHATMWDPGIPHQKFPREIRPSLTTGGALLPRPREACCRPRHARAWQVK